jgi:hypothetical protein
VLAITLNVALFIAAFRVLTASAVTIREIRAGAGDASGAAGPRVRCTSVRALAGDRGLDRGESREVPIYAGD